MNKNLGLIGRKIGTTQFFQADGNVVACTVIDVSSCTVVGHRTQKKDGYSAVILGFGKRKAQRTSKPLAGQFKDKTVPQIVRELRLQEADLAKYEIGKEISAADLFEVGQFVDCQSRTRGRGFQGVVRRWSMAGQVSTHGTHEYFRHGGSIGTNMTPGRTLPNVKMPGHYGDEKLTVLNQKVARIDKDSNLLLVAGGVPGSRGSLVFVRGAIKKVNAGKGK